MTKKLSEMTRADWLSRRWVEATSPGGSELFFTDAGDFPPEQRAILLSILHGADTPASAPASGERPDAPY